GTITMGNRQATRFVPLGEYSADQVGELAALASAADLTPEGKSIVELFHRRPVAAGGGGLNVPRGAHFIEFTAQTRMSGIDLPDRRRIRKGAPDAILRHVQHERGAVPKGVDAQVAAAAPQGATPLLVCEGNRLAGLVV